MAYINTIEIKDLFKACCYHPRPYVLLRALKIYGHNKQLTANCEFVENNTQIKNVCGWCNEEIPESEFDYFAGYWKPNVWRPVHKNCKQAYKEYEAIECQTIDANCNDCKHFVRGKNISKLLPEHDFLQVEFVHTWKEERELEAKGEVVIKHITCKKMAKIGDDVTFNGFCTKKNIPTHATPNLCTGYSCFEHRKGESQPPVK